MRHGNTRNANILLVCAGAVLSIAAVLAIVEGRRAFAAALIGVAVAVVALVATIHAVGDRLEVAVERAPRDRYWKGYEDRGEDNAAGPLDGLDEP